MALRFLDSFDHYTSAQLTRKWTSALFQMRDTGLHGYGMRGNLNKGMLFPSNTVIMEMYVNPKYNVGGSLFRLGDTGQGSGYGNPIEQVNCSFTNDGSIAVDRWGGAQIAQTAPDLVRQGGWYHLGWRVFVDPTAGSVEVRLNGATVVNVTGVPTTCGISGSPTTYWSGEVGSFGMGDNGNAFVFDDLVVMDDVDDGIDDPRLPGGGGFDKFLGAVIIKVKRPNGAGDAAGWAGVPTGPNWENVNDLDPDDDATHNVATVVEAGASDLFQMENLLPSEDVLAVQSNILARKTDDGFAAVAKLVKHGGTVSQGVTVYQPNTYSYMHAPEPTAPDGSLWTKEKWDAIQYGYKRIL